MLDFSLNTEFLEMDYPELKSTCLGCQRCGLAKTRTQVVVGAGPVPCDLMVVGEGPGEQEDLNGIPFIGKAGQLLTKIFESVELDRERDIYITNIVKCRPPGNRDPLPEEIDACKPYLIRQIQLVKPKILLVVGAPSLRTIVGGESTISKVRGTWIHAKVPYMDEPLYIMPLFHPSYLLRQSSREKGSPKWLTWQDMKEVKAALDFYQSSISAQ